MKSTTCFTPTVRFHTLLLVCQPTAQQRNVQAPAVSDTHPREEWGYEETPGNGDQTQHMPSSLGYVTCVDEVEETVITSTNCFFPQFPGDRSQSLLVLGGSPSAITLQCRSVS